MRIHLTPTTRLGKTLPGCQSGQVYVRVRVMGAER